MTLKPRYVPAIPGPIGVAVTNNWRMTHQGIFTWCEYKVCSYNGLNHIQIYVMHKLTSASD